jgi:hypothetical protein
MSVPDMEANGKNLAEQLLLELFPGETACKYIAGESHDQPGLNHLDQLLHLYNLGEQVVRLRRSCTQEGL